MKKLVLPILCLAVLAGCREAPAKADYLFSDDDAMVFVTEGKTLLIVDVPSSVVKGYAAFKGVAEQEALPSLFALPIGSRVVVPGGNLQQLRTLVGTIGNEMGAADGYAAMKKLAVSLGKSGFPATWERLTGMDGLWKRMVDKNVWRHYDLARFLEGGTLDWTKSEPYFRVWLDGALEEGGRRA